MGRDSQPTFATQVAEVPTLPRRGMEMNKTTAVTIIGLALSAGLGQAVTVEPKRRYSGQTPVRTGGDPGVLGPSVKINPNKTKQKAQRKARKANRR